MKHILLALISLCCLSCSRQKGPELTLYVAASLSDVIQEIGTAFETEHAVKLHYNFASSGALARQILAAPRADLFLSASLRWMDSVHAQIVPGCRQSLLTNQLVVIANQDSSIHSLSDPAVTHLAIGDPQHVPAGAYAKTWLESRNLWSSLQSKISPCPDARAPLIQVEGNTDVAGIVYRTDYIARKNRVRLLYEVPLNEGPHIEYLAAMLKDSPPARELLTFLRSETAQAIYQKHGFIYDHATMDSGPQRTLGF